jgi:hypothetical protein
LQPKKQKSWPLSERLERIYTTVVAIVSMWRL